MRKACVAVLAVAFVLGATSLSFAVVIGFTGGTAYLTDGTNVTTNNSDYWSTVDYYVESGVKFDFVGGPGYIGDYYKIGIYDPQNSVIHAHWGGVTSIVVSKVDGSTFDLTYMDETSNTTVGGGKATGLERTFVTSSNGSSLLLPSSDWGFDWTFYGDPGDGVQRLWLDSNFLNITSFTVTSENAYCFGLDNFFIDQPPPPEIPEPSTVLIWSLLGALAVGIGWWRVFVRSFRTTTLSAATR